LIGGQVFAGSTRMFPIANGYSTSIFYGDLVELTTDGTIVKNGTTSGASATAGIVGVFLGCEYSSTGGPIFGKNRFQYWLASTAANDAVAYVSDDPDAIYQAALCSTGTTLAYAGQWAVVRTWVCSRTRAPPRRVTPLWRLAVRLRLLLPKSCASLALSRLLRCPPLLPVRPLVRPPR
jgi:hypothetical protein